MDTFTGTLAGTLAVGIGATALTDLWGLLRRVAFGVEAPDYAMLGRWVGHMPRGRFRHESIHRAAPVPGERLIGWASHYLTGVVFAAVLVGVSGGTWLREPALQPALALGSASLAAPFLLMQPAMGNGVASSRSPHPARARLQSLVTHLVFGAGLYASGVLLHQLAH
jgi:hypothetical protein